MLLRKRLFILLAALLVIFAGTVACGGATVNVSESRTPVATGDSASVTRTTEVQSSGLATRAPPTKQNATATKAVATKRSVTPTKPAKVNGFQTIAYSDLPPEAKTTLGLIKSNGPFPYRQDGQVFQNREGILPKKQNGYYHEYTVETPGSDDRGARRVIAGNGGELYYTADHYSSFKVILTNE